MVVTGTVVTGTVDNTDQRTDQRNNKRTDQRNNKRTDQRNKKSPKLKFWAF
jgi:hypothetical protein